MHLGVPIGPSGPLIIAQIRPSVQRLNAMATAQAPIPPPVNANLLIDTGASNTMLDQSLVAQLGLTPTGSTPMHSASTGGTPVTVPLYDVSIILLPGNRGQPYIVPALAISTSNFASTAIDGLLGRDVLSQCRMTYTGFDGFVLLSF